MRHAIQFCLLAGSVFAVPQIAAAQPPALTLDELSMRLIPETEVWVTDAAGKEIKARVIDVTSSTLAIETKRGRVNLHADDVSRVRQKWHDPVWTGALIGGVAGIAYPLWYFNGMYESGETLRENVDAVLMAGAIGACIGGWIDSRVKGKKTIYERPRTSRLMIAPTVAKTGAGVQLALQFSRN